MPSSPAKHPVQGLAAAATAPTEAPEPVLLLENRGKSGTVDQSEKTEQAMCNDPAFHEPVINLCSPVKPRQRDPQLQQHTLQPSEAHQASQDVSRTYPQCSARPTSAGNACLQLHGESAQLDSLSQAGKADFALLHDLRPAGCADDQHCQPADSAQAGAASGVVDRSVTTAPARPVAAPRVPAGSKQDSACQQLVRHSTPEPLNISSSDGSEAIAPEQALLPEAVSKSGLAGGADWQQQPQAVHARIRALLKRPEDDAAGGGNQAVGQDVVQALTQAEVIEAQTSDEEKRTVSKCMLCGVLHNIAT